MAMKKYIRICQRCRNTFETDEESKCCTYCEYVVTREVKKLLKQGKYQEADKLLKEIQ